MEKVRFLPWIVGALVLAGLIGVRFMPLSEPAPYNPKPFVYVEPARAPVIPAKTAHLPGPPGPVAPVAPAPIVASPVFAPKPTPAPALAGDPKWELAYHDDFETPESIQRYKLMTTSNPPGELRWNDKHHALLLKNKDDGGGEVYAAIHQSLPGDLRIRFKAMCRKSDTELGIGLMFSVNGSLRKEDGYFAEWETGLAKVKRRNKLVAQAACPTPQTSDRWVNLEIRQTGGKIALFMQDSQVLEWTDPEPLIGQKHDLVSFYVWDVSTIVKGLNIERNPNDPIKPLSDDPAADDNMLKGIRNTPTQAPGHEF